MTKIEILKKTIAAGDGVHYPKRGYQVQIEYSAYYQKDDDTKVIFDSSKIRKKPMIFRVGLGQTISGLDAVDRMSFGEHSILKIPWQMAYGEQGLPNVVPPKTDVTFDIHLIKIE